MKVKVREEVIRASVAQALGVLGVYEDDVEMPISPTGFVGVSVSRDSGSTFRKWYLYIPNDQLAEMIHGDMWDGDAEEDAFRFGGGGYDPVWFECGVLDNAQV